VAVVQDDAAAAAVGLEPQGAAFDPLEALPAGRGRAGRAGSVSAGLREGGVRQARRRTRQVGAGPCTQSAA
jgi:hypothetical protein